MMKEWPTKNKDLKLAKFFIEKFALSKGEKSHIGMFEMFTNLENKSIDFQLSPWVVAMTLQFQKQYGIDQGEWVARKILTLCFTQHEQIH